MITQKTYHFETREKLVPSFLEGSTVCPSYKSKWHGSKAQKNSRLTLIRIILLLYLFCFIIIDTMVR